MAATRPSIMSDGATMSAPASAWLTAILASSSSVRSFTISPSCTTPQWPWSMYAHRQTSVTTTRSGASSLMARIGQLHDALGVVGAAGRRVLVRRDAEQQDGRNAELLDLAHLGQQVADRELLAAGHGGDRPLDVLAVRHEQRVDEVVGRERRLAHHAAQRGSAPQPPHAVRGKVHVIRSFHRRSLV